MTVFAAEHFKNAVANNRMRFHQRTFGGRELTWLEQHVVGQADFADVVQRYASLHLFKESLVHHSDPRWTLRDFLRENARVELQAAEMARRFAVARLGHFRHREQKRIMSTPYILAARC